MKRYFYAIFLAGLASACGDDTAATDTGAAFDVISADTQRDVAATDTGAEDAGGDVAVADAPPIGDVGPVPDTGPLEDAGPDAPPLPAPKRLVIVQTPHGMVPDRWTPSATGRGFDFNDMMAPLEAIRDDVTIVSGVDLMPYEDEGASFAGHGYGLAALLTGQLGTEVMVPFGMSKQFLGGGASLDTIAAVDTTPFDVVFLDGARVREGETPFHLISWAARDDARFPSNAPDAFDRLFGTMDPLPADVAALQPRALAYDGDAAPVLDVQFDIASAALRHGLTNVVTIQTGTGSVGSSFPSFGHTTSWHEVTHNAGPGRPGEAQLVEIWAYFATQIVELADSLRAVPENGGTMLDNTLIVWISHLGRSFAHDRRDIPIVLIGNLNGAIDSGQHVAVGEDRHHNDFLLTVAQLFDPAITTFGDSRYVTGPITEILR